MTASPSTETPRHTATLNAHIAKYLAQRAADHDGDVVVVFTGPQRDAFVEILNSHASLTAKVAELEKFGNYVQHLRDCRMFDKYKRVCDCGLSDLRSALSQTKEGRDFDFPIVSDHGSRTP